MNNRCVSQFSLPLSPAQQHSLDGDREHREGVGGGGGGGGVGGRGEDGGRGRERKRKGRRAAECRTQGEIKGASSFIDCIKIGLHLQLS